MGRAFDSFMDWMIDGPAPVAFIKMTAVCGVICGALVSPFIWIGSQNQQDLQNRFSALDATTRVEFNNVAACAARGYRRADCERAQQEAVDIAGALGTTASYNNAAQCQVNHGTCTERTDMIPVTTFVNNVPITNYIYDTKYYPDVVGWQATRDGLNHAVPLYRSAQDGQVMRGDRKLFPAP